MSSRKTPDKPPVKDLSLAGGFSGVRYGLATISLDIETPALTMDPMDLVMARAGGSISGGARPYRLRFLFCDVESMISPRNHGRSQNINLEFQISDMKSGPKIYPMVEIMRF